MDGTQTTTQHSSRVRRQRVEQEVDTNVNEDHAIHDKTEGVRVKVSLCSLLLCSSSQLFGQNEHADQFVPQVFSLCLKWT